MTETVADKFQKPDIDEATVMWKGYMWGIYKALHDYKSAKNGQNIIAIGIAITGHLKNIQDKLVDKGFTAEILGPEINRKFGISDYAAFFPAYTTLRETDLPAIKDHLDALNIPSTMVNGKPQYGLPDAEAVATLDSLVDKALEFYTAVV